MIVALLAPLAACDGPGAAAPSASGAAAGPGASETRMVDASFVFGRARSDRGAEVRFAGRLEERDGGTFACVALAHNAEPIAKVAAAEMRVALRFYVGEEKLDARLRFAAIHADGPEIMGREANCAALGLAWEERFGVAPVTLRFRTFSV